MLSRLSRITNAQVGLLLLIFAIAGFGGSAFAHIKNIPNAVDATQVIDWWAWLDGALQNFSTEVVGAILTFGLIEVLVGSRKEQDERIARLVKEVGSSDNVTAKNAVNELRTLQMLATHEGVLRRAILPEANLSGADLVGANLSKANLIRAHLEDADLGIANLSEARLIGANLSRVNLWRAILWRGNLYDANLSGASLMEANLLGADLTGATLEDADLVNANLSGAFLIQANLSRTSLFGANLLRVNLRKANLLRVNLRKVNLSGANLTGATLEEVDLRWANLAEANFMDTIWGTACLLPDETLWTSDTDMSRYTDPNHPDFWQPDWAKPVETE